MPSAHRQQVSGDWLDVDAAVETAASQAELAMVRTVAPDPQRPGLERIYTLRTAGDEPVTLVVRRTGAPPEDPLTGKESGPSSLEVAATVGLFGDPRREERLINLVRRRLQQLQGRDYAPVR